jgi:hypothetical protein
MVLGKRAIIIVSLIVGLIGVAAMFLWDALLSDIGGLPHFPLALVFGFLSCFFICVWYSRFMQGKNWWWGILFGPLFGGLAGAIAGALTNMAVSFDAFSRLNFNVIHFVDVAAGTAVVGGAAGACSGLIIGLFLAISLGPILARITGTGY